MDTVELLEAIGDDVGFISQVRVAIFIMRKLLVNAYDAVPLLPYCHNHDESRITFLLPSMPL